MSDYVPKTDVEIKALAMDMISNRIFTSAHCATPEEVRMAFLPLAMMDAAMMDNLLTMDATLFYEETNKALPRGINGMPMFMSMKCLSRADHERLTKVYAAIRAALDAV